MSSLPYRPIACSLHDELLAAATRRTVRNVSYTDEQGAAHEAVTTIDDVFTQGTEEFARLGTGALVRLDLLKRVEGTGISSLVEREVDRRPERRDDAAVGGELR